MIVNKDTYTALFPAMTSVPFLQSAQWQHITSIEGGVDYEIVYFIDDVETPSVMCFGRISNHSLLKKKLMIDGICTNERAGIKQLRSFFASLLYEGFSIIQISDISMYASDFEIAIRQAGFIRPLGLSLCPMSLIVDLERDFEFHRMWRRAVRKSKESGNCFVKIEHPEPKDASEFVRLFNMLRQRKHLHFTLSEEQLMTLFDGNYDLFFVKDNNGKNIAGRIAYHNGSQVYDVYAANSTNAMETGAAYHIQEAILEHYKDTGYRFFDYGRISPSADKMNDIYLSKSYSGGYPIAYNGQWCWYRNHTIEHLYSFFNFEKRKMRRY